MRKSTPEEFSLILDEKELAVINELLSSSDSNRISKKDTSLTNQPRFTILRTQDGTPFLIGDGKRKEETGETRKAYLGVGGSARVKVAMKLDGKKGNYIPSDDLYAVKIYSSTAGEGYSKKEVFFYNKLYDFAEIVKDTKGNIYLLMPFLPGKELNHLDYASMGESEFIDAVEATFNALDFLNQHDVCHGDSKGANILYDKNSKKAHFVDFGYSYVPDVKHPNPTNRKFYHDKFIDTITSMFYHYLKSRSHITQAVFGYDTLYPIIKRFMEGPPSSLFDTATKKVIIPSNFRNSLIRALKTLLKKPVLDNKILDSMNEYKHKSITRKATLHDNIDLLKQMIPYVGKANALLIACEENGIAAVRYLLSIGADGNESLFIGGLFKIPFIIACNQEHIEIVELFLQSPNPYPETDRYGNSPLHNAILKKRAILAKVLIKNKYHLNLENRNKQSPLCLAVETGQMDIARQLLHAGAALTETVMKAANSSESRSLFECVNLLRDATSSPEFDEESYRKAAEKDPVFFHEYFLPSHETIHEELLSLQSQRNESILIGNLNAKLGELRQKKKVPHYNKIFHSLYKSNYSNKEKIEALEHYLEGKANSKDISVLHSDEIKNIFSRHAKDPKHPLKNPVKTKSPTLLTNG